MLVTLLLYLTLNIDACKPGAPEVAETVAARVNPKIIYRDIVLLRNSEGQKVIETLEFDLELIGLTGVEDKLQDQVKDTLETLRNAGIRVGNIYYFNNIFLDMDAYRR